MNYLWLDLETTGLEPYDDFILEVGITVTGADLDVLKEASWLTPEDGWWVGTPEIVMAMHEHSGLYDELMCDFWLHHSTLLEAERGIVTLIEPFLDGGKIVLAGSGVAAFDLQFIKAQMPELARQLTYYTLDIGVVRRFLHIAGVELPELGPVKHRALEDVEHHLNEARRYLQAFEAFSWQLGHEMCK